MAEIEKSRRPEFDEIKGWIQEHLGKENKLILGNNSANRTVIINSVKGKRAYKIPQKTSTNVDEFKEAWVDVYLGCLDYLNKKVTDLFCKADKSELTLQDENTVIVGNKKFTFFSEMSNIEYINTLEGIVDAYDNLKRLKIEQSPIKFSTRSVEIVNPALETETVISAKNPDVTLEGHSLKKPIYDKTIYNRFAIQKLCDDEVLSPAECGNLRDEQLVFVTCTSLSKGENTYRDNIDLFVENIPSVPRGAFITGRAIKCEQVVKETSKIMKLCGSTINTPFVMYEVNNETIQSMGIDREAIKEAVKTIEQILDVLANEKYKPLVCLDSETSDTINTVMGTNYTFKYPTFLRVLPREVEKNVTRANLIVMDPQYDNDRVVIKNEAVASYLELGKRQDVYSYGTNENLEEHLVKA